MNKYRYNRVWAMLLILALPFHAATAEPDKPTIEKLGDETYKRGVQSCDLSIAEKYYREDPEDLSNQVLYAICLVIAGRDSEGVSRLYHLADYRSSVQANFFLADYLETDGRFLNPTTTENLDGAIKYYLRTLAIIDLIPTYPELDDFFQEKNYQMHLKSLYRVPYLYLVKYKLGALGDYCTHAIASGTKKPENCGTYPKYNTFMRDSLNKVVEFAGDCAGMRQRRYFNQREYKATTEACGLMLELAKTLIPLEAKRQEILLQSNCENLNKTDCPEYYETHSEIHRLREDYHKTASKIRARFASS